MPLYLCRWLNGDCSVVWARNEEDAIVELDQIGNAEECPITKVGTFQVHFVLTDRGELTLEGFGEGTREEIMSSAYPLLEQALDEAHADDRYDGDESLPAELQAAIAQAVEDERRRIGFVEPRVAEPQTEIGRGAKQQTGMPTVLIDRLVRAVATKKLNKFKGRAKPS